MGSVFALDCSWVERIPSALFVSVTDYSALYQAKQNFSYNAAVFTTVQANAYTAFSGPKEFFDGTFEDWELHEAQNLSWFRSVKELRSRFNDVNLSNKLEPEACAEAYSQQYVSKYGDVLLVEKSRRLSPSSSDLKDLAARLKSRKVSPIIYPSYDWLCSKSATNASSPEECIYSVRNAIATGDSWAPMGKQVLYCRAESTPELCTLSFNTHLAYIVLASNFVKALCMFITLRLHNEPALMTVGDAIESFLNRPDDTTCGLCLHSAATLHWKWQGKRFVNAELLLLLFGL